MSADPFRNTPRDLDDPASDFFAVTPHNSTDFAVPVRGLYVGVAGNVAAVNIRNVAVSFIGVPAGAILPICAIRVNSTGTTATNLVGLL